MAAKEGLALVELDEDGVAKAFRADVLAGLSQPQKAIPARWLYDDAGSELFEAITQLPEYYPTRAETEILSERSGEFRELIGPGRAVVEFGSGSSVNTPQQLEAIAPAGKFPGLPVHPVEADFMREVALPEAVEDLPKLGFFPGSTIGNMVARTAVDLLRSMRATLGRGSLLLIGMDLIKDVAVLEAAYDDAAGVTAEFNLNLARRINRELGGTIPVEKLRHVARWNDTYARIEMHLEALEDTAFEVSGRRFALARGETIHTENSHKFDLRSQNTLLLAGGWTPVRRWTDSAGRFSLILAEWTVPRGAP